jgi:trehalose/maltose hydrolase-like predicted phosphorylase
MHITGDIAFAARQYIAATGNQDWLLNELGGELIYETARFWGSRAMYNNEKKQYEILSKSFSFEFNTLHVFNDM